MNQPLRNAHACALVAKQLAERGHVHAAFGSLAEAVAGIIEHLSEISAAAAAHGLSEVHWTAHEPEPPK